MHIIIAGAGTVGYSLAESLSFNHDIVVIDKERRRLDKIEEDLDVLTLHGDIENPKSYEVLDTKRADLFIAVTDSDEANLLATLIVDDAVDVAKKIIRLKNDSFLKSHVLQKLAVDHTVFPDLITAQKVRALLTFPKANNVKVFHQTKFKLISLRVEAQLAETYTVADVEAKQLSVVAIEREEAFLIPERSETIRHGDLLYLFGESEQIRSLAQRLEESVPDAIKRIVIFGADTLAQKIAKTLSEKSLEIKMIDKDIEACRKASEFLEGRVRIVHAAYDDRRLFEEEGLKNADMAIAASMNDEKNIVKCMESKEYGIPKVVAINNDKAYYRLMHKLGIVVVRGSKASAHYAILEKVSSDAIVTQRHFCGGEGILFMRKIYASSPLIGKRFKAPGLEGVKTLVVRDDTILDDCDGMVLQKEDIIIVFAPVTLKEKLQRWIHKL